MPLHWLLTPLSLIYGGVVGCRNAYYDRVPSATRAAGVPVISVGNLTVGGTGKTPFVIEVVRRLLALDRHPAILTRGYKAVAGEMADEVREFREAVPDVPVVVNADRVAGAVRARAEHQADCLVLDDGFQHRRLARDLDIVLIDALWPWGGGWLLPAGRLREPLGSLRRADVFVITRANQVDEVTLAGIAERLRTMVAGKPVLRAGVEPEALVDRDGGRRPATDLRGRRVLPVCGIGNPRTFAALVSSLAETAGNLLVFPDHHHYTAADAARIVDAARKAGADLVVTTRKDWVKLTRTWSDPSVELVRLDARVQLSGAGEQLDERLRQAVEKRA